MQSAMPKQPPLDRACDLCEKVRFGTATAAERAEYSDFVWGLNARKLTREEYSVLTSFSSKLRLRQARMLEAERKEAEEKMVLERALRR